MRRTMFNTFSVQPRSFTESSLSGLTRLNFSRTSDGMAIKAGQASRLPASAKPTDCSR
jgi:hypothetical protein